MDSFAHDDLPAFPPENAFVAHTPGGADFDTVMVEETVYPPQATPTHPPSILPEAYHNTFLQDPLGAMVASPSQGPSRSQGTGQSAYTGGPQLEGPVPQSTHVPAVTETLTNAVFNSTATESHDVTSSSQLLQSHNGPQRGDSIPLSTHVLMAPEDSSSGTLIDTRVSETHDTAVQSHDETMSDPSGSNPPQPVSPSHDSDRRNSSRKIHRTSGMRGRTAIIGIHPYESQKYLKAENKRLRKQAGIQYLQETQRRAELDTLEQDRLAWKDSILNEYKAKYEEEIAHAREVLEAVVQSAKEKENTSIRTQDHNSELGMLREKNEILQTQIKTITDLTEAEVEEKRNKIQDMEQRICSMKSQYDEELKKTASAFAEYDRKIQSSNLAVAEVNNLRTRNGELEQRIRTIESEYSQRLEESINDTAAKLEEKATHMIAEAAVAQQKQIELARVEVDDLRGRNEDLITSLMATNQQCEELKKQNNKLTTDIAETELKYQGQLEARDNAILAMRRRLDTTSSGPMQTPSEGLGTQASTLPGVINSSQAAPNGSAGRHEFLQSDGTPIGIVPLQPLFPERINQGAGIIPRGTAHAIPNFGPGIDTNNTEAMGAIVRETLRQMGASDVHVMRTRKKVTRSSKGKAIKAQQAIMSKEADIAWKAIVRETWKETYSITTMAEFSVYKPASEDEVGDCEAEISSPGETWVLDFNKGWDRSRWNRLILRKIYEQVLLKSREDGWNVPNVLEDYLMGELYGQVKRAREAWSQAQPRYQPSTGRFETAEEIMKRVESSNAQRLRSVGSRARLERKYKRRMETVEKVIAIKLGQNAPDLATWEYFRKMLEMLGSEGMSSEEEGVEKLNNVNLPVFRVRLCMWRAPQITEYVKYIDREGENPAIRGTKGNRALPRISTEEITASPAPTGLPRKMYNPAWLEQKESTMPGWVLDELQISKETFELLSFAMR